MIKAVLIDDEPHALAFIEQILLRYFSDQVEIVACCSNAMEGMRLIESDKPELVFLDVEMPGCTGFELLERLNYRLFQLVFITAHNHYAIKAFRENATDYILKPIDPLLFQSVVRKVIEKVGDNRLLNEVKTGVLKGFNGNKIALPTKNGVEFVDQEDIIYAKASGSYSMIHLKDDRKVLLSKNLKALEANLSNSGLLRVSRSTLINLKHLTAFSKSEGGWVTINHSATFNIGFKSRKQVLKILNESYKFV